MKNLIRIVIAIVASQLLLAGIARASTETKVSIDQKSAVCVMPDDDPTTEPF